MEREAIALMGDEQREKCTICGIEESRHGTCCGESNAKQNISVFNGMANGKCVPLNVNGSNLNLPDEGFVFDLAMGKSAFIIEMEKQQEESDRLMKEAFCCNKHFPKNPNLHQVGK